jgi:transposase-like protein
MASSSYISVNRAAMDAAITELRLSSTPYMAAVARKYGLVTSTLRRRWKEMTSSNLFSKQALFTKTTSA